jgi:hypothetical protein
LYIQPNAGYFSNPAGKTATQPSRSSYWTSGYMYFQAGGGQTNTRTAYVATSTSASPPGSGYSAVPMSYDGTYYNFTGIVSIPSNYKGDLYLHVYFYDDNNNKVSTSYAVYNMIRNSSSISITPNSGAGSSVSPSVSVNDADGMTSVQTSWSSSASSPGTYTTQASSGTSWSGSAPQSSAGTWYLWVKVTDTYGQTTQTVSGAFIVDQSGPSVSASPTTTTGASTGTITITGTDNESGVTKIEYSWSNTTSPGSWVVGWSGSATASVNCTTSQTGAGLWYLHVRITNAVGGVTTTYYGPYNNYSDIMRLRASSGIIQIPLFDPPGTRSLRVYLNGKVQGIDLVETTHPSAGPLRIRTASGTKAIRKL